ncbi:hypothetical protein Hamer_G013402 [Homarus americanus]|uniref:Uncharacterized protein n=1 Tax=Homarus americanus TaxID=6706 RepID=A0A8J5KHS5_HOMAM|nr:hypothetical protein Hamer_G013402 [Homarus americanus]
MNDCRSTFVTQVVMHLAVHGLRWLVGLSLWGGCFTLTFVNGLVQVEVLEVGCSDDFVHTFGATVGWTVPIFCLNTCSKENKTNGLKLNNKITTQVNLEEYPGSVLVTYQEHVMCSEPTYSSERISLCSHEEAENCMVLHAADEAHRRYRKIFIKTVDTDVVVLCIGFATKIGCECHWVGFGTGRSFCYLNVTQMAEVLAFQSQFVALLPSYWTQDFDQVLSIQAQAEGGPLQLQLP